MHPLIAFLAFIFSPSDDWALKQAFELFIDPKEITTSVDQTAKLAKQYPSIAEGPDQIKHSLDTHAIALWAEILTSHGNKEGAKYWLTKLDEDPMLPPELRGEVILKLGEAALATGDTKKAADRFQKILEIPSSPRALDARINLIVCALIDKNLERAQKHAKEITDQYGTEPSNRRSIYPLGLTSLAAEKYEQAAHYFEMMGDDPRAHYFLGLSLRKLGKPHDALVAWEPLLKHGIDAVWRDRTSFQIAETYFELGDDPLSRIACEKLLERINSPIIQYRLATIDMRTKRYENALARLQNISDPQLNGWRTDLLAEAMIKTGKSKELFKLLAKKRDGNNDAQSVYQTAWAGLFEKRYEESLSYAESGLKNFYDADYTPRLLLLQGLAYEHLGKEAEALATYQTIADRFPQSLAAAHGAHWTTLAYMRVGRPLEAVTHGAYLWNKIPEEIRRQQPDTAFWLGEAHLRLKRYEDADRSYQQFLTFAKPDNPLLPNDLFQRSVTLAHMDRKQEALAMLDQFSRTATLQSRPEWLAMANLQRGNIFFNEKNFPEAVVAYRAAGDSPKSLYQQGLALYRMDYFTNATEVWTKLAAVFPNTSYAEQGSFRAARTQFELGAATQAVQMFAKFVEQYPESRFVKEARLQSAHALYNAGDVVSAAPLYSDYLAHYPTTEDIAAVTPYLASCFSKMGKSATEMAELLNGLPPTDELASARWLSGADNYNQKNFDEADNQFASLLAEIPTNENAAVAHFYRGESLFLQQKWADASNVLDAYVKLHSKNDAEHGPLAMFHRGVALYNQDQLIKAAKSFQELAEQYPDNKLAKDAEQNMALCYHYLGDFPTRDSIRQKYNLPIDEQPSVQSNTVDQKPENTTVQELPEGTVATIASNQRDVTVAKSPLNPPIE